MNMTRRAMAFLFLALMALTLSFTPLISAQETATPTPEPTSTSTPTATLTLSPTAIPTNTATAMSTSTATQIATLTPTSTATEAISSPTLTASPTLDSTQTETLTTTATLDNTPSATANATPTASVTPSATGSATSTLTATPTASATDTGMTLIYADNFDSGDLSNWTVGAGWSLVPSEGGQAMQVTNSTEPLTYNVGQFLDIAVSARVMMDSGSFSIRLRESAEGAYVATFNSTGQITIYRGTTLIGTGITNAWTIGEWRTIKFSVIGSELTIASGIDQFSLNDTSPLGIGDISLSNSLDSVLTLDNIELYQPTTLNPSTATPTVTATSTFTATITPTAAPANMIPQLILSESFDGTSQDVRRLAGAGWIVIPSGNDFAIGTISDNRPLQITQEILRDFIFEAQFSLSTGSINVTVHKQLIGTVIQLDMQGNLTVSQNGQMLTSTSVNPLNNAWNTLRIETSGTNLTVLLNQIPVLSLENDAIASFGELTIHGENLNSNPLRLDNLLLWGFFEEQTAISGGFTRQSFTQQSTSNLEIFLEQVGDVVTRLESGQLMALNRALSQTGVDTITDHNLSGRFGTLIPGYSPSNWSWSANGQRVVFECPFPGGVYDICVYNVVTGEFRNITNSTTVYDYTPTISPDGRYIAYASSDPNLFTKNIYLYDYNSQTISEGIGNADYPVWQGNFVYYRDGNTNQRILRTDILSNTFSEIILTKSELEVYGGGIGAMDAFNTSVIFSTEKWDCTVNPCERTNRLVQINALFNGTPNPTSNTTFLFQSQTFPQINDVEISPRGNTVWVGAYDLATGGGYSCFHQLLTGLAGQSFLNSVCGLNNQIDWSTNVNLSAPISTATPTPSATSTPNPSTCLGEINTSSLNVRTSPRTVDSFGAPIQNFASFGPLSFGTQVNVVEYDIHDAVRSDFVYFDPERSDITTNYGWFLVENPANSTQVGWVVASRVSNCDSLAFPIVFNDPNVPNSGRIVQTNEFDLLPVPPPLVSQNRCIVNINNNNARIDCASQVYHKFYFDFQARLGRQPNLEDVISIMAGVEVPEIIAQAPEELILEVVITNYRNSCLNGCDGNELIEWLASKQAWYSLGNNNYSQVDTTILFNRSDELLSSITTNNLTQGYSDPADDWGNWWYRDPNIPDQNFGYYLVLYSDYAGHVSTRYCRREVLDGGNWRDYVFAIVTSAQDALLPSTNERDTNQRPPWLGGVVPSFTCPRTLN